MGKWILVLVGKGFGGLVNSVCVNPRLFRPTTNETRHNAAKALKGFGGAGVLEVVEDDEGGTYRAVYTVKFEHAVFVLHCFQKKSKQGIATPKEDIELIRSRLKVATTLAKELCNEKTHH